MGNVEYIRNVNDLISLDGDAFLRACYRTILQRDIDPMGCDYYSGLMYKGFGKSRIIYDICHSSECARLDVELPGLKKLIWGCRFSRILGLGWFARWVFDADPQDSKSRAIRAIHAQIAGLSFSSMPVSPNSPSDFNALTINPSHMSFPNASAEELAMYAYLKQD